MNSNSDYLSEAAFHQLDGKIEMFVLPDIAMICIFNVFVLFFEKQLFKSSRDKLSN